MSDVPWVEGEETMTCGCDRKEGLCGYEEPGVYDGVLFWFCLLCGARWQRWPEGDRRHTATTELWALWDAEERSLNDEVNELFAGEPHGALVS